MPPRDTTEFSVVFVTLRSADLFPGLLELLEDELDVLELELELEEDELTLLELLEDEDELTLLELLEVELWSLEDEEELSLLTLESLLELELELELELFGSTAGAPKMFKI